MTVCSACDLLSKDGRGKRRPYGDLDAFVGIALCR